ncbi:hypothetical protein Salat_1935900 [Sesamum alatum]|uniref:Uncharacterized protein n=1 Tax=Sesamum alatum TaxID=300844 RepID=A0AAE2CIM1_9LAMI|nr:hypothetical protein Salat_1935900 [Sesamum alatum]
MWDIISRKPRRNNNSFKRLSNENQKPTEVTRSLNEIGHNSQTLSKQAWVPKEVIQKSLKPTHVQIPTHNQIQILDPDTNNMSPSQSPHVIEDISPNQTSRDYVEEIEQAVAMAEPMNWKLVKSKTANSKNELEDGVDKCNIMDLMETGKFSNSNLLLTVSKPESRLAPTSVNFDTVHLPIDLVQNHMLQHAVYFVDTSVADTSVQVDACTSSFVQVSTNDPTPNHCEALMSAKDFFTHPIINPPIYSMEVKNLNSTFSHLLTSFSVDQCIFSHGSSLPRRSSLFKWKNLLQKETTFTAIADNSPSDSDYDNPTTSTPPLPPHISCFPKLRPKLQLSHGRLVREPTFDEHNHQSSSVFSNLIRLQTQRTCTLHRCTTPWKVQETFEVGLVGCARPRQ